MTEFESAWKPDLSDGGPRSWSGWQGAYRFVTDGSDLCGELEEQMGGGHGRGHPRLQDDFFETVPERRGRRLVEGWLVPTADGRGYGLLAYDGSEERLEEACHVAATWLAKPVHLLSAHGFSGQVWQDPQRYAIYSEGGAM